MARTTRRSGAGIGDENHSIVISKLCFVGERRCWVSFVPRQLTFGFVYRTFQSSRAVMYFCFSSEGSFTPVRVSPAEEDAGLDISGFGEEPNRILRLDRSEDSCLRHNR